jgi:hypothetical protein
MAIDPNSETLLSLADAARALPRRRAGKRPHVSCVYRWTTSGCKGVVLESIQVGGTRCTGREALGRFFERLTYADDPRIDRTPNRRQRAAVAADRESEREGV